MNSNNITGFVVMVALAVTVSNLLTTPVSRWPLTITVGVIVVLLSGLVTKGLALLWQRTRGRGSGSSGQ
jgi:hypothetical protein